jgi:hypothetical protein
MLRWPFGEHDYAVTAPSDRIAKVFGHMNVHFRHWLGSRAILPVLIMGPTGLSGCDGRRPVLTPPAEAVKRASPSPVTPRPLLPRAGISELEPGATLPTAAGQQIFLPIHSRLSTEDGRPVRLAVNVVIFNADESRPILVTLLRHRDGDGKTVRDYLRAPARLAPKATLDVLLRDADPVAPAASVLVEWVADRPVVPPIVEAVMIGTIGSQSFSFTEHGRVLEDRQHPSHSPQ